MNGSPRLLALGVSIAALLVLAVDTAHAAPKEKKVDDGSSNPVFAIPKEITLTADQQTKLDEIKKEWGPKMVDSTKKVNAILTKEQQTAKKDAVAKAKSEGKTGKERTAMIDEAIKLTDDQKALTKTANEELAKQRQEIKEQIFALLTDEQKPNYKLPKSKKAKAAA